MRTPLKKDFYHILQVDPSAEQEVIEAAYRRLAKKFHPDKDPSPKATLRMQEINEAYTTLQDPAKRAEYDSEHGNRDRDFATEATIKGEDSAHGGYKQQTQEGAKEHPIGREPGFQADQDHPSKVQTSSPINQKTTIQRSRIILFSVIVILITLLIFIFSTRSVALISQGNESPPSLAAATLATSYNPTNTTLRTKPTLADKLVSAAQCTVVSSQPTPDSTERSLFPAVSDVDWIQGPDTAAVTFVEYSDFQ